MIHNLMRNPPVVLQDVVVLDVLRDSNAFRNGQDFGELVVGYVVELCAVVFWDDQLGGTLVSVNWYPLYAETERTSGNGDAHRMTFAQWPDVKESKCLLALEDLHRRDLA
jgi:hypothetical protein